MQYMGGKAKIGRRVVQAILGDTPLRERWLEPFVGGGNVMEHAAPHFGLSVGMDAHPDLILMWQGVVSGWTPGNVTRDIYDDLRTAPPSAERGYVGFGASFGGKWFGGYGVSPRDGEVWRASQRALVRQGEVFRKYGVRFLAGCFGSATPPPGTVVYCDPPYSGTTGYSTGGFDHSSFYSTLSEWAADGCAVYVSEYAVPEGVAATEIWQREKRNVLARGDNQRVAVERLFRIHPTSGSTPVAAVSRTDDTTPHFTPLDIETDSADTLYTRSPDPSYVRLTGVGSDVWTTPRGPVVPGQPYVTVNGSFFDFPALDRHCGIPVEQTIPFSRDLRTAAFQHDPPTSAQTKQGPAHKSYSMAALAERYLGESPDKDELQRLAREFGGYGAIPVDDPRYLRYLRADLDVTRRLNAAIPWDPYEEREAWVSTVTARTTLNGFQVDTEALRTRVAMDTDRAEDGRVRLAEDYGFPLVNEAGKEAKAPQRTKAGKAAFEAALRSLGFPADAWPRGKDGTLSLGKEVMGYALEYCERENHRARGVIEAVSAMNGVRNNAANLLRCVSPSGRVHPRFEPFQSTRRWSVQEPGLTVLKKGVADSERNYLVADEDDVLVSIDLDQIDIRGAAAHSQDPALIALLNDGSRDIHTEIAVLSGVPRKQAKTLDLGWLYGRGARAMAEMPGMDLDAAQRVTGYMSGAFPGVTAWQARVREQAGAGILLDNGFGGRLRAEQDRAYTQAPALVGQSATRELVAEGLLDLARRAPEMLPMLRVIVHDEVVASVPRKDAEECARILQSCLSRQWAPAGCSIPVNITAGQGKPFTFAERWGALYM